MSDTPSLWPLTRHSDGSLWLSDSPARALVRYGEPPDCRYAMAGSVPEFEAVTKGKEPPSWDPVNEELNARRAWQVQRLVMVFEEALERDGEQPMQTLFDDEVQAVQARGAIKAISLWQPWASLVIVGAKRIETRSWRTDYTGPFAIHAAKRYQEDERELTTCEPFCDALCPFFGCEPEDLPAVLPLGAVLGTVTLTGCRPTSSLLPSLSAWERAFGDYSLGRYGWLMEDVQAFKEPIPARGMQQLWEWRP